MKKILFVVIFSAVTFVGLFIRATVNAILDSSIHKTDYDKEKKFQHKGLIAFWAISTVAAIVIVVFFVD